MHDKIRELAELCTDYVYGEGGSYEMFDKEKFAELIISDCTRVLFNESERLFGLYSEEDNMDLGDHYEICSNQCINDITLIETHFGVEE